MTALSWSFPFAFGTRTSAAACTAERPRDSFWPPACWAAGNTMNSQYWSSIPSSWSWELISRPLGLAGTSHLQIRPSWLGSTCGESPHFCKFHSPCGIEKTPEIPVCPRNHRSLEMGRVPWCSLGLDWSAQRFWPRCRFCWTDWADCSNKPWTRRYFPVSGCGLWELRWDFLSWFMPPPRYGRRCPRPFWGGSQTASWVTLESHFDVPL